MTGSVTWALGVDIGGTYVDIVARGTDGSMHSDKQPYPPGASQATATLGAIRDFLKAGEINPERISRLLHGTTLATNVLLERRAAPVGIITTQGFEDILAIGRQNRDDLYSLAPVTASPVDIFPTDLRIGISGRMAADGTEITPLDTDAVAPAVERLIRDGASAIAVCLLHSTVNPAHERAIADIISAGFPGLPVSLSHQVDPAPGEYERFLATALDAYIKPMVVTYLHDLVSGLAELGLPAPEIVTSDATVITTDTAAAMPLRLAMSGPAAALRGFEVQTRGPEQGSHSTAITLETGGTTSDIGLIRQGELATGRSLDIGRLAIRQWSVDISSIPIGGGSILRVNDAGALRVGPDSAGSDPGPAAFGRGGTVPTLTDALVVLGRLPDSLAGGIRLDDEAAKSVMQTLAGPLGCDIHTASEAAVATAATAIAEAIKSHAFRRGTDPAETILMVGGGGGGQHAAEAAELAGIETALVIAGAAIISAAGCLACYPVEAVEQSLLQELTETTFAELCRKALQAGQELPGESPAGCLLDIAYRGQQSPLEIPFDPVQDNIHDISARFDRLHETLRGHAVGNGHMIHRLRVEKAQKQPRATTATSSSGSDNPAALIPDTGAGPQSLFSDRTSIWVPRGWNWRVLGGGDVLLSQERRAA
ncbi:MAG: hydantoinase/oxoprolinase family protein [Rhodospirillales bacterium]